MNLVEIFGRRNAAPCRSRMGMALRSSDRTRRPPEAPAFGLRHRRREAAASDHLYFAVRSLGVQGRDHVLQYAFADDRGNVVMSAFVRSEAPAAILFGARAEDLAMEPLDTEAFDHIAARLCGGATLVAYQRVLQGGLLPYGAARSAAGVECAWRRFQQTARRIGLAVSAHEPLTLNDCLAYAGLPVLESEDAALRALAIRSLWRWMDEVG
jgi:hypothetical protein